MRFMGLFDTVAQFGPLGARTSNYDLTVAQGWQWVAHAVALHEHRWTFPLTLALDADGHNVVERSEEHKSELQSLMHISYAVFCLKKKRTDIKASPRDLSSVQNNQ